MFQSKIFSYKFNSFHDEERREGALGLKITSIQEEERGEEDVCSAPRMETKRKIGRVDNGHLLQLDPIEEVGEVNPLERQDSELSTVSSFSEVDLDEFYVEDRPPSPEDEEEDERTYLLGEEEGKYLLGDSFISFCGENSSDLPEVCYKKGYPLLLRTPLRIIIK